MLYMQPEITIVLLASLLFLLLASKYASRLLVRHVSDDVSVLARTALFAIAFYGTLRYV